MSYVDVYVLPVPRDRLADYRRLARLGCKVWMEHGALDYVECIEDNIDPGKRTSFPRAVKRGPDEVVIVAWIVFKSRADRNRINKLAMTDPRMTAMDPKSVPVDGKRMFWGGFKPFVQA